MNPPDARYSKEHVWVRVSRNTATTGITDYARASLGEVLAIELPAVGDEVKASSRLAALDCAKTASVLYAAVSGTVTRVNDELVDDPGLVNQDPYGRGWVAEIELSDPRELDGLMDLEAYERFLATLV